ncbi:hypothetical protein D9757_002712 [Collybiopsis confluens]|uniref:Exonuclease domain-containing protein n=1 Tax=Collybiopsis confluens TaxID=2823264 RepID=A0A8H5MDP1_9AGAR|nr:hypothetical protein D9757_002712 [Collybiopsis confluens]
MFSPLGLFRSLPCPERDSCTRLQCVFSHKPPEELPRPPSLTIPVEEAKTVPAKRLISSPLPTPKTPSSIPVEPPRKLQKLDSPQNKHVARTGVPILNIPPATSSVAIPVRQAMLKTLYDHFVILYDGISSLHPNLASDHARRQEQEVYSTANKFTYRNAVIQSVAAIKRRSLPTAIGHPSIGTEGDLSARAEAKKSITALHVTAALLAPYIPSLDQLKAWGYIVDVPPGPSHAEPSLLGKPVKCERCGELFVVRMLQEQDPGKEECLHHWGRISSRIANGKNVSLHHKVHIAHSSYHSGEKIRAYNCCFKEVSDKGCVRGPHVFYESEPETLHLRHAFSQLAPSSTSELLDVVALDCEMIYTTGGMRVARVSVVDGSANQVFDELVRMDEGIEILDFNTRFSGITQEMYDKRALLPLSSIQKSLNLLIGNDSLIIGHALENDLKTLRLVHHRVVDTVFLYPHPRGAPYRRSLRDLAREHLNLTIQDGDGSSGHSSLEDAIASLDLVRLYLVNNANKSKELSTASSSLTWKASSSSSNGGGSRPKVTPVSYFLKPRQK